MRYAVELSVIVALGAGFLSDAAKAQAFSDLDSRYAFIGPGNVEAKTGAFTYFATDLSVGSGDFPSRLEFQRWRRSTFDYGIKRDLGQFSHNFDLSVGCSYGSGSNMPGDCPLGSNERAVRIGSQAHLFTKQGPTWVSNYGDGAQLIEEATRWIFRGRMGDEIIFPKDSSFFDYAGTTHLGSLWRFPDGQFITFFWEVASAASGGWNPRRRLSRVVNSRGYGFQFSYLQPGGGSDNIQKRTISSVSAIAPGCVLGTTTNCDPAQLGTVTYSYSISPSFKIDSVTDARGNTSYFQWTSDGKLVSQTNPAVPSSYLFQNQYAGDGITQQTDPLGNIWRYRRTTDGQGNIIGAEIEDPDHKIMKYGFSIGIVSPDWIEDPNGKRTKYVYDAKGRLTSVETPMGTKTSYLHDSRGNVTSVTVTPAASSANDQPSQQVSYTFPTCDAMNWRICNRVHSVTDQRGGVTTFSYNVDHGGLEAVLGPASTPAARPLTKYTYDTRFRAPNVESSSAAAPLPDITILSQVERCLSSNGTTTYSCPAADSVKTSYSYDTSTAASRSQFLLNTANQDPGAINAATAFKYDVVGNLIWTDGPRTDGDVVTTEYNKNRNVTKVVAPDPDGPGPLEPPETSFDYNPIGDQTAVRRKLGATEEVVSTAYNAARQVTQVSDPRTGTVAYSYDIVGRPSEVSQTVDGQIRKTKTIYDALGRVTQQQSMFGVVLHPVATYAYDDDSRVTSAADAKGNTTNYCYDGYGRTVEVRFPSASNPGTSLPCPQTPIGSLPPTDDFERIHYDAASNLASIRLRDDTTINFQYDAANRMTLKDVPDADRDVTYTYDMLDRRTTATLPGINSALSVSWVYDKLGRVLTSTSLNRMVSYTHSWTGLTTIGWPDGKYMKYQTDPIGRPTYVTGIQQPIGGGNFGWPVFAEYSYDQLSRRTRVDYGNATETLYSYDSTRYLLSSLTHNLSGTAHDATWSFGYNEAGQVKQRTLSNDLYAWNGSYNAVRPYAANGLNQYTTSGSTNLRYDRRGNVIGGGGFSFTYDKENRLVAATGSGATNLTYDAIGRLAKIISKAQTTEFLYDGERLIGEYDGAGLLLRRVIPAMGVDEPLAVYQGAGTSTRQRLFADAQGSIVATTDDAGNAVQTFGYGSFGEASLGMQGRFGYTGQVRISEIGDLYHYRSRFYSPRLGRFLQPDPIGYNAGLNLYAYVGNDPINLTDPSGLDPSINEPDIIVTGQRPQPSGGVSSGWDAINVGGWSLSQGWGALANSVRSLARNRPTATRYVERLPQNEKKLSQCMINFLGSQGLGSSNLGSVTFHRGDGGNLIARIAFRRGHPAITIGNNIYVRPTSWGSKSSPRGNDATYFEEIIHTIQWNESGAGDFSFSWALGSLAGGLFTGDLHNSPLEAQAIGMAKRLLNAYRQESRECPD